MDHVKILKQAWEITRHYRALWVFGIILALTSGTFWGGGGSGGRGGGGDGKSIDSQVADVLIVVAIVAA